MMKKKLAVTYVVAKTRNEARMEPGHNTLREAKEAKSVENTSEKWYCFAKFPKSSPQDESKLVVVGYFDCISPLGEVKKVMQWFDIGNYINDENAKKKFQTLKV